MRKVRRSGKYLAWVMPILLSAQFWQAFPATAGPAHAITWHEVMTRHYGTQANASGYSAVVVTGRDNAWAFGGTNPGGPSVPVAVHLAHRQWQAATLPAGLTGFISSASAASAGDIWAASGSGGYVLHWDGVKWTVAKRWQSTGEMTDITALSSTNVWVFGTGATGLPGLGSWHFNGHSWSRVYGIGGQVFRASAASANDIWGIAPGHGGSQVVRFNGKRWRLVRHSAMLGGIRMQDILATSSHNAWVAGNLAAKHGDGKLVLAHWNGKVWVRIVLAASGWAGRLAPDGRGGVWLTAEATSQIAQALVLHVSADGLHTRSILRAGDGSGISGLALLRGPGALLATGGYLTPTGGNAAVWAREVLGSRTDRDGDHDADLAKRV